MKNLITLIAFLIFTANAFAIIHVPYSNSFKNDGTVNNRDKAFIQVRNKTGSTILKGQHVSYDTATYDDGITVLPTTDPAFKVACIAAEAITDGSIGSCQVYGYNSAILYDGVTTARAGDPIYAASTTYPGYGQAIASGSVNAYNVPIGVFFDASSSSGSVEGFINLL